MPIFSAIPLFLFVLIIYNAIVLLGSPETLGLGLLTMTLISGAEWSISVSDLLLVTGLVVLYIEIFKATRTSVSSVINHTLSMLVFIAFIIEFISVKGAGNSTFLLLGLMALMDVVAGFTITIVAARRDFNVGDHGNL